MRGTNRVFLIGRLGRDPESRFTKAGTQVVTLSVATNRNRREADGSWTEETDWHRVKVFRDDADRCMRFLRKGSMLSVEGSLTYDKWTDDDGRKRSTPQILGDRVNFLSDLRPADEVVAEA